jgi:hypothetical protein
VVLVIEHGASVEDCLDQVLAWGSEAPGAEVVLVDLRAGGGPLSAGRARVLTMPAASVEEGRLAGIAAARGRSVVVLDESARVAKGLLAELVATPTTGQDTSSAHDGASLDQRLDLLRDLDRGLVTGPADFAESATRHQAERIRAALLAEPGRHGEVVAGARARRLELPWAVVNRGRARDLAILHNFVPFIDTSGLVAARRLREWGLVTDVVSQDLSHRARRDEGGMRIAAEVIDRATILPGRRHDRRWSSVVAFVEAALAEVSVMQTDKEPYRSVYSRAMPPASHFAAAVLKLRSPELRWVAEFSDPLLMNAYGESRTGDIGDGWLRAELTEGFRSHGYAVPDTERLFGWGELVAYAFADEVVFTNDHQRDFMLGYCGDRALAERARGVTTVMHHPVPGPELYTMAEAAYELAPGRVHVGYFGNFYANRGLTEVIEAVDGLALAERARLQLHVFTNDPEPLRVEVLERGLADVITVGPMFGYLEYLNLITRFDLLLINDYATSPHYVPNPYLPAKLADYLGSGTPIWALYEPGSVLSATDVEHATPLGDSEAAAKVLHGLLGSP